MAGKRTKIVYCYQNINGETVSEYYKDRNSALKWMIDNKNNFNEPIFLMKREILAKRWKELFPETEVKQ